MRVSFLFLLILVTGSPALCAPVYKTVDSSGVPSYTTKPSSPSDKPASLPPIMKQDMKVAPKGAEGCQTHGGVNCQAGPDTDGSVICYDGFKGAILRYRFSCSTPKLEISEISEKQQDGTYTVYVRNGNSVEAKKTMLSFMNERGESFQLTGPSNVDPLGLAEYVLDTKGKDAGKVDAGKITVTCSNCTN